MHPLSAQEGTPYPSPPFETAMATVATVEKPKRSFCKDLWILFFITCVLPAIILSLQYFVLDKPKIVRRQCETEVCKTAVSHFLNSIDTSVNPCQDFYKFACGNWNNSGAQKSSQPFNMTDTFRELDIFNSQEIAKMFKDSFHSDPLSIKEETFAFNLFASCSEFFKMVDKNATEDEITLLCSDTTRAYFPEVTARLFYRHKYPKEMRVTISNLFLKIRESLIHLVSFVNGSEAMKSFVSEGLRNTQLIAGYDENMVVVPHYGNLIIETGGQFYIRNLQVLDRWWKANGKESWATDISNANAFYISTMESVFLPAGIAYPPFFSTDYPSILNIAKMGFWIGHELSHALSWKLFVMPVFENDEDNEDSDNNDRPAIDEGKMYKSIYAEHLTCLADHYSRVYMKLPNSLKRLNGSAGLEENFADCSGIRAIYEAFQQSLLENNREQWIIPELSNYTTDQIFFIAAAQNFCSAFKDSDTEVTLLTNWMEKDDHMPYQLRVKGALRNFGKFSETFNCSKGTVYNPSTRCNLFSDK